MTPRELLWTWLRGLWVLLQIAAVPGMVAMFLMEVFLFMVAVFAFMGGVLLIPVTGWRSSGRFSKGPGATSALL